MWKHPLHCAFFHGTNIAAARSIIKNGFDIKKAQKVDFFTNKRTVLGPCVYFAPEHFKAEYIAKQKFGNEAVVLEYMLDTGNMLTTGSECYEWQEDYDSCYLIGKSSGRQYDEGAPQPTSVEFDEVGVSYRVLDTNLKFIAFHECKKQPVQQKYSKPLRKKQSYDSHSDWTPSWYRWDSNDWKNNSTERRKKKQGKNPNKKYTNSKLGKSEPKASKINLPDVVSTRFSKYVSPPKEGKRQKKSNKRTQRRRKHLKSKSQKTDSYAKDNSEGTYRIYIPDNLLCPNGYSSASAEISTLDASDEYYSHDDTFEVKENEFSDYDSGSTASINSQEVSSTITKANTAGRRAFRTIETTNVPIKNRSVKTDSGSYTDTQVSGYETGEAVSRESADLDCSEPTLALEGNTPPPNLYESSTPEGSMAGAETNYTQQGVVPNVVSSGLPPLVSTPNLFANVISVGMHYPVTYIARPMPILFTPICVQSQILTKTEPVSVCALSSPGSNAMFGVLQGEKGC